MNSNEDIVRNSPLCQPSSSLYPSHHHDLRIGNYYSSSEPLDNHTNIDSYTDQCDPSLPTQSLHNQVAAADELDHQAHEGFNLLKNFVANDQNHQANNTTQYPLHQVVHSTRSVTLKNSLLEVPYHDLHFDNNNIHGGLVDANNNFEGHQIRFGSHYLFSILFIISAILIDINIHVIYTYIHIYQLYLVIFFLYIYTVTMALMNQINMMNMGKAILLNNMVEDADAIEGLKLHLVREVLCTVELLGK